MEDKGRPEVVVVTGASGGIGRATAIAFAKRGAHVALLARGLDGLEGARRDVEAAGGKALVIPTDVAYYEQVETAADQVENELGPIDVWVNNAMVSIFSPFSKITPEEYRRITDVTYHGVVYGTMAALKWMQPRDRGSIVQVGSALAYRGIPIQSAYCGAKHAIQGFTESLRAELVHDKSNIRLAMVQLPGVNTPQFSWVKNNLPGKPKPTGPIYQPEVAADAIVWAAYNEPRELNLGLVTDVVILGNKVLPGIGDFYLGKTGFEAQQMEEPDDPNRPHNMWEPVPGDFGAHGRFDGKAKDRSLQFWLRTHRPLVTMVGTGVSAVTLALARKGK